VPAKSGIDRAARNAVTDFLRKGTLNPGHLTLSSPHNFFLVIGTGL
jgi:hypothetical protein